MARKTKSKFGICDACGFDIDLWARDQWNRGHMPICHCPGCAANVRSRNARCEGCGTIYFDGLSLPPGRGRFCGGCGASLNKTLKGLPK